MRSGREYILAALLFALTLLSATVAGFQQAISEVVVREVLGDFVLPLSWSQWWQLFAAKWQLGLPFSLTLLGILLAHELGHFFAGRYHRIDVSLPYFIPAPTEIGTFGAVIRMRGLLPHRTGLLDVGAAGPLVGFIVAVPAYIWGMAHSTVITAAELPAGGMHLGDSLITHLVQRAVLGDLPPTADVLLHPVAFAAWIGFFVTSLNLLPLGQLDGGHILFALRPRIYRLTTRTVFVALLLFGAYGWPGWFLWAFIGWLMGISRHPLPIYFEPQLDARRRLVGALSIATFFLTFVPNPFALIQP